MNNNFSITGYKDSSPDKNNSHNIIPGNSITMQGVSKSLTLVPIVNGKPQYDRKRTAKPGDPDIQFEEDVEGVLELPYAQIGTFLSGLNLSGSAYPIENLNSALNYGRGIEGNSYAENANPAFQNPYINQQQVQTNLPGVSSTGANPTGTSNGIPPMVNFSAPTQADIQQGQQSYLQGVDNRGRTAELSMSAMPTLSGDDTQRQMQEAQQVKSNQQSQRKPFIGAINPYGGWNMENTSTALGAFAQNKNVLGTVASAGKLLLSGARNYFAGSAAMKNYNESMQEYEDKEQENQRTQGWHWLQKGGEIGKILTGNYITGDDENPNPNVEFEKGEYAQTPDGKSMEVIGDRHSEGGEMATLPEGSRVISDYLKIGSDMASYFKKEHNLNVKSGSTFSTVLDQYKKKIGLDKLIDEEAKLMEKIADQEEVEFEGTREINLEVLSKKVNDMKPQKEELEDRFNTFTNLVYEKQEQTKEPEGYNFEKQEGGDVQTPDLQTPPVGQTPPQSTDGQDPAQQQQPQSQIEQLIAAYSQITGTDPATVIQQLQALDESELQGAIQQMMQAVQQAGGQQVGAEQVTPDPTDVAQEQIAEPQQTEQFKRGGQYYAQRGMSSEDFDSYLTQYRWEPNYGYGDINAQKSSILPVLDRMGIKYADGDLNTQTSQDAFAGQAQNAFRNQYKATSDHYSSLVAGTQTGLQNALDNKLVSETQLKNLGVKVKDGTVLRGSKGIVPKDNEAKLTDLITKAGEKNPEGYKNFVDKNFVDNKWYFRFPDVKDVNFKDETSRDEYIKKGDYKLIEDTNGKKIYYSNKQGLYFNPTVGSPSNPDGDIKPIGNRDRNYDNGLPMMVPDQSNLPPNYIPTTLRQIGSVQANPIAISPEATLQELNRQYNTASNKIIESNPYTAGSAQANLQAQANSSINQAYSQTALANAQDQRNVDNINEERILRRDMTNMNAMEQYEKEAITGLDNYIREWRSFIDSKNQQNVNNWNLENSRAAFNAVNDNYKIGSMGWYQTDQEPVFHIGNDGSQYMYNKKTKQYTKVTQKSPDGRTRVENKTETTNRKKGGMLLSDEIKKWLK